MQAIVAASDEHIQTFLIQHPQWQLSHGCLKRGFQFADFVEAFGFMSKVALLAERANHHPQWSNVYRSVEIELITHEVQGISQRDFDLAMAIDHLL